MARGTKKGKLISLFKHEFNSVIAIQNGDDDEQEWFVFINNAAQLRFRLIENYIIYVTGIKPLGVISIDDICKTIVKLLSKQTRYTALIDTMENTSKLCDICSQMDFPCASNPIYSNIEYSVYQRLRDYYRADDAMCGYYILAIAEKPEEKPEKSDDKKFTDEVVVDRSPLGNTGRCRIGCVEYTMAACASNPKIIHVDNVLIDRADPDVKYVSDCYGVYQGFIDALKSEIADMIILGPTVDSDFGKLFRPQTNLSIFALSALPQEIISSYMDSKSNPSARWFLLDRCNI